MSFTKCSPPTISMSLPLDFIAKAPSIFLPKFECAHCLLASDPIINALEETAALGNPNYYFVEAMNSTLKGFK